MENDRERLERERLRREADEVMQDIELPESIQDLNPRLIGRFRPTTSTVWPTRQGGMREVFDLFLRTNEGQYFIFHDAGPGGFVKDVDTRKAHEILRRLNCEWFATESERLEFEIFEGP